MINDTSMIPERDLSLSFLDANIFSLGDIINKAKTGEIYKATFVETIPWYITKMAGCFYYCNEKGEIDPDERPISLTYSNMKAEYKLIN